jgi:hypothetical protein
MLSGKKIDPGKDFYKGRSTKILGKKAKVSHVTYSKGKQIKTKQPELWTKCLQGELSIDKAYKEVKNQEKQKERDDKSEQGKNIKIKGNEIDFRHGDFMEVLDDIPDGSIDLILTDPPYIVEAMDEWEKLAIFAKKKLKKHGFVVAYSGHKNIYEIMTRMNKYLDYYWIFALIHTGSKQLIKFNNISAGWKPIIVYQNGFKKADTIITDIISGTGTNKVNHDWEQSELELSPIILSLTKEGDIICDPFTGSGTTLIAVKKNKRIGIGAEVDEKTFNLAKKRISDEIE